MAVVFVVNTCKNIALTQLFSDVVKWLINESNNNDAIPFRLYSLDTPRDKIYPYSDLSMNVFGNISSSSLFKSS